ncbi:Uncharacterised protein [Catenibacterium mitsuokai]|jgi:hypothetical protein|nr:Uncharacterised protein [Catenibacterium mitsuokai]
MKERVLPYHSFVDSYRKIGKGKLLLPIFYDMSFEVLILIGRRKLRIVLYFRER